MVQQVEAEIHKSFKPMHGPDVKTLWPISLDCFEEFSINIYFDVNEYGTTESNWLR